jgi:hypothetical protein
METKREQAELYNQFAQEYSEVQMLANRIGTKIGRPVEFRYLKSGGWGFYAPKNFAYALKKKGAKVLCVFTKEEWAKRAHVDWLKCKSKHRVSPKGWWNEPQLDIDIDQDNPRSLNEVASILARVCEARHR